MRLSSYTDLKRMMAVGLVAAFVICSGLPTATQATTLNDKKTFKRAQQELREGDFESAELILRELLAKDGLNKDARLAHQGRDRINVRRLDSRCRRRLGGPMRSRGPSSRRLVRCL